MNIRSVRDVEVSGKRVLVRVDFNVPLVEGVITDDTRIKAALPTISWLLEHGAKVSLLTHLGRPEGKVVESLRTAPLKARLNELLPGADITMLENVRFDGGDETNDAAYAKKLAEGADIFVNDAFAVSHRAHASVVGITKFLPSYAGFLLENEIKKLSEALTPPPGAIAIIGGAKFETKQPLLKKILSLYSTILLGGALGNDIIKARGFPFGASLVSSIPVPIDIASSEKIYVAGDIVMRVLEKEGEDIKREALVNNIRANESIVDIGSRTAKLWSEKISAAPFVLWNGPMGIYEEGYTTGTDMLANALAKSGVRAVVGGGDTIAALSKFSFDKEKVFISTGGGAMLEFLTAGTLPGIEVLTV